MDSPLAAQSQSLQNTPPGSFKESLSNAVRFWEPRRILYNLVLALFVILWIVRTWPHFRPVMRLINLARLAILAILANVCYSSAYLLDFPLQHSTESSARSKWRWGLWTAGMLLAVLFENYWIADEIYPDVS
jgi:hypothetical protein